VKITAVDWFAVSSVLFVFAMFVALMVDAVPDFYALPLGMTAIVSALLSIRAVIALRA